MAESWWYNYTGGSVRNSKTRGGLSTLLCAIIKVSKLVTTVAKSLRPNYDPPFCLLWTSGVLCVDWSGNKFYLHYNQKTIHGDMGVVLTTYTLLLVLGHCFISLTSGALVLTEVGADSIFTTTRKPDMGTWAWRKLLKLCYQLSGHHFIVLFFCAFRCWLKWRPIPSSLQPENHTWGHGRIVNFLHYVTSY